MSTVSTSRAWRAACPHVLALRTSLAVEPFALIPPAARRISWRPRAGRATGRPAAARCGSSRPNAVADHFPKTLRRRPGIDFRVPRPDRARGARGLHALARPSGGHRHLGLDRARRFASDLVERGRALFNSEVSGSCAFCHESAGALAESGFNGMFDTGVARLESAPARRLVPGLAGDGGFGASPPSMSPAIPATATGG